MKDNDQTKDQFLVELDAALKRIAELEDAAAHRTRAERARHQCESRYGVGLSRQPILESRLLIPSRYFP